MIRLIQPQKIYAGAGASSQWIEEALTEGCKQVLVLSCEPLWSMVQPCLDLARAKGLRIHTLDYSYKGEPTTSLFADLLRQAEAFDADAVVGLGGGSVLDVAKLLAALLKGDQNIHEVFGNALLHKRHIALYCIPTTAGTGSEVSPNAILFDESDGEKKGIISPYLIPDASFIDPDMCLSLPSKLTAETGMDALCHCIEAYTNKFAHPAVDLYALQGIGLIVRNLEKACRDGQDKDARLAMSMASMYGGLCLGPVNTCGVHALSYGLAGKYHLSHGLANAVLLPEVLRFNQESDPSRTASMASVMGLPVLENERETAASVIETIAGISAACGIPAHLSQLGVREEDIPQLAGMAMNVTRLLKNNPREITFQDAVNIYQNLL